LLPEAFVAASDDNKANVSVEMRMQDGFDHSYYFIATFVEDHLRFHAANLQ